MRGMRLATFAADAMVTGIFSHSRNLSASLSLSWPLSSSANCSCLTELRSRIPLLLCLLAFFPLQSLSSMSAVLVRRDQWAHHLQRDRCGPASMVVRRFVRRRKLPPFSLAHGVPEDNMDELVFVFLHSSKSRIRASGKFLDKVTLRKASEKVKR